MNRLVRILLASSMLAALGHVGVLSSAHAATFPAEAEWIPLTQGGISIGDPLADGQNNAREVVGDATSPAVAIANNGIEFFVRLRLDDNPTQGAGLRPYGWGVLVDIDGNLNDYELSLIANGVSDTIEFAQNTVPTGVGDPSDNAETLIGSYPVNTGARGNTRVTAAGTSFNGTPDYYLDFAIPLTALDGVGITPTTPLIFIAGTSSNGRSLSVDIAATDQVPGPGTLPIAGSDPVYPDGRPIGSSCGDGTDTDGDGLCDISDTDDDGDDLSDMDEVAAGTDSTDADSDDDGVSDGDEPSWNEDTDNDGMINARDTDSDGDGLLDGTELGIIEPGPGTDVDAGGFIPDADPSTQTNPLDPDTDAGGVSDGVEDSNGNGRIDAGELDPNNPADDTAAPDTDGDGIPDSEEGTGDTDEDGTPDYMDIDSDDDGVLDGEDNCVLVSNSDQADANNNGIGDACSDAGTDADSDGIPDDVDNCPGVANSAQLDQDSDSIGDDCDPDRDGDGFNDILGVSGGGCSASGMPGSGDTGLALIVALLLGLPLMRRRAARVIASLAVAMAIAGNAGTARAQLDESSSYSEGFGTPDWRTVLGVCFHYRG